MGSAATTQRFVADLTASSPPSAVTHTVAVGRELLTRIGNQSNLILDSDLDSYYTMSVVVLRFPELLDVLDQMRRLAHDMAALPPLMRQAQQTRFLILEGRIDAIIAGTSSDYSEAFAASGPMLRARLWQSEHALMVAMQRFRHYAQVLAGIAERVDSVDAADTAAPRQAIDALRIAWSQAHDEQQRLLQPHSMKRFIECGCIWVRRCC